MALALDMKSNNDRAPVWTAFIGDNVHFVRRTGPKTVCLAGLTQHIFSNEYTPPRTSGGEVVLDFRSEIDADGFVIAVHELMQAYLQ
jgi:hypothetical protein